MTASSYLVPLTSLKYRAVRDLAWALCRPSLFYSIPNVPEQWLLHDYVDKDVWPWLQALDKTPAPLLQHLSQQRSTRLGIYFEQLLSFYFEHYPRFKLLAKNYQVNDEQRTLGEFDFIIYDRQHNDIKHIEAAVKFYLGHENHYGEIPNNKPLHNWHQWVGPNHKDTLAIKMRHLKEHQLILGKTSFGRIALSTLTDSPENITSRLLFAGRFYFPLHQKIAAPKFSENVNHSRFWTDSDSFLHHDTFIDPQKQYCLLPRQYWLSEIVKADIDKHELHLFNGKEIMSFISEHLSKGQNEWQFAELDLNKQDNIETKKFFIINSENLPADKSHQAH